MDTISIILTVLYIRVNAGHNSIKIVLRYFLLVLVTSILLNLSKFLETSASWGERMVLSTSCGGEEEEEEMETWVKLSVTWLRMNTTYIHIASVVR